MNNLLPYCGLVDARISASEKDLPVHNRLRPNHLLLRFVKNYPKKNGLDFGEV